MGAGHGRIDTLKAMQKDKQPPPPGVKVLGDEWLIPVQRGWASAEILGLFAAAAILLAAFVVLESRQRLPMLDLSLFRINSFVGARITIAPLALKSLGQRADADVGTTSVHIAPWPTSA